jgi:hypothetical protein
MERGRRKVHQDNVFAHHRPTVLQSEIRSVANLDWGIPTEGEDWRAELGLPVFFRKFAVNETFD